MAASINFPLFAPMNVEGNQSDSYDYLMCLVRDQDEFCAETCGDFYKMLAHLRQEHGLVLNNRVDFCGDCEIVFKTRLDSLQHYLNKALSTQHFVMTFENPSEAADLKEWLAPIYHKLNAVHNVIMNRVLFSEDMPPLMDPFASDDGQLPETQEYDPNGYDEVDEVDGAKHY